MGEHLGLASLYGMKTNQFSDLAAFEVREILLVAPLYDAFVFEEDGQLNELLSQEYRNLDLSMRHVPRFSIVGTGRQALALLGEKTFDMVVSTAKLPDMSLESFTQQVLATPSKPSLAILAAHAWELPALTGVMPEGQTESLFLWQGNVGTLLAMIFQEEDRRNADADILKGGVQAIILVEDDTRFLSLYLPHIYTEVTKQTALLVAEGINPSHRLLRLHARPKILLARSWEQAWDYWERYRDNVLAVLSDVSFPRAGKLDSSAGISLFEAIRKQAPDVAFLLHSSERANEALALSVGAPFIHKEAPDAIAELHRFLMESLGFGDFIFRNHQGHEVARASTIREFLHQLSVIPDESVEYHASCNHFSRWFAARTEFELAAALRPRQVSDFSSISKLRHYLASTVEDFLRGIQRHAIADFSAQTFDEFVTFAKLGSGSLGGKGRGLAFTKRLLAQRGLGMPGVEVSVPQTVVVASDVFEGFVRHNDLGKLLPRLDQLSDEEILDAYRAGRFSRDLRAMLARFLEVVREPLAVRSSSILEDSPYQPFAGVYATLMLPNNHSSLDVRLAQLLDAIKVVFASTFMKNARAYLRTTPHRLDEERMAVLIQRLVGRKHGRFFYPTLSGVAASHNFYPFRDIKPEDGVAQIALGLGKAVVEGLESLRFCPNHPGVLPQFSATKDILRNAQRRFWALDMDKSDVLPGLDFEANIQEVDVSVCFGNGSATSITSTYVRENDALVDGLIPGGSPLVTFARLLRGWDYPLPRVLAELLKLAHEGMGKAVEIEFAVQIDPGGHSPVFSILQVRPMVVEAVAPCRGLDDEWAGPLVVDSFSAMGHGRLATVYDVLVVQPDLPRSKTVEAASFIESVNKELQRRGQPFALIGPGRWGSRDQWLGIPVTWSQISGVRAIVETDFDDLQIEPSQGSHFFHNLTAFGVTFLTVHSNSSGGSIDWSWLASQPVVSQALDGKVRHIRVDEGIEVLVDGPTSRGVMRLRQPLQE